MSVRSIQGDVREELPKLPVDFFDCIVTSPPYFGLRDYGCEGQIGLEPTLDAYLETIVGVCRELRRVLKPSGVCFINIGDSYCSGPSGNTSDPHKKSGLEGGKSNELMARVASQSRPPRSSDGLKPKDLMLVPERLGIALQKDSWWVRSNIKWVKPNPMPESVTDRPTSAHETIWMLTKSERYWWDADAVRESFIEPGGRVIGRGIREGDLVRGSPDRSRSGGFPHTREGRNLRNVWTIATQPFQGAHFATFPPDLVERCLKAACRVGGHVLDPFAGSGTVGLVADRMQRDATLIDLNTSYIKMAMSRIHDDAPLFAEVAAE